MNSELLKKYDALSPEGQQEVDNFIDFMLIRHKKTFDIQSWKEKIKGVSVWSEDDVKVFDENQQMFNQWKTEEW
jgi:hypothetical protein